MDYRDTKEHYAKKEDDLTKRQMYTADEWNEMCREADSSARMMACVMTLTAVTVFGGLVWLCL
jgi:hypothetical protein